eukprot:gene24742-29898_t
MSDYPEANEATPLKGSVRTIRLEHAGDGSVRHYSMSTLPPTTFATLTEELQNQRLTQDGISRQKIEQQERRTLYGSLPFVAAFGMQKRETTLKKVISSASMHALAKTQMEEEKQQFAAAEQEVDVDELAITLHLIMAVAVAIITQFLVGYNTSVMNAPSALIFPTHSLLSFSLAVSLFPLGGGVGSMAGGVIANKRGRRGAMVICMYIFLLGGLIMFLAPNIWALCLGRFIVGMGSGVGMVVVPVYLGEIAPPTLRGTLGTFTQFAIVIGILASNLCAYPLIASSSSSTSRPTGIATSADTIASLVSTHNWRYLFLVTPVLCVVQLILSRYLLESPRYLLNMDPASRMARINIKKLRAFRSVQDVEQEVQHYLFSMQKHKTIYTSAHSIYAYNDLIFHAVELRVLVMCSIMLQIAQQLSGINVVFYYSTMFLGGSGGGLSALVGTICIGVVNVLATVLALKLMDNTPRRLLLLSSSLGMIVSMIGITITLTPSITPYLPANITAYLTLACLLCYVVSFAVGLGPIPWLIVAEMFDAKYVATAMGLACLVNWLCNFLVGLSFPFVQAYLGHLCFLPYAAILTFTTLYTY